MSAHGLGPNGAMLYCLEYLEANLDWLDAELDRALTALEAAGPGGAGAAGEGEDDDEDELDPVSGGRKERQRWRRDEMYVVFDTPGQVELSTNHDSLKHILEHLRKRAGFRVRSHSVLLLPLFHAPRADAHARPQLAAVHLMDASHILDAPKYVAVLLLALRTMLQLELPHVNVLSKVDLLGQAGDLRASLSDSPPWPARLVPLEPALT